MNEKNIDIDYTKLCPDCNALLFVDGTLQATKDTNDVLHCDACHGTSVNYLDLD